MPSLASEFGRRGPSLESWLKPEWLELRRGWDNRILSDAQSHKKLFLSHSSWPSWHHRLCRDQDCKSSSMAFLAPLSRRQRQNMAISLSNGELSAASFAHLRKHAWPRAGLKGQQTCLLRFSLAAFCTQIALPEQKRQSCWAVRIESEQQGLVFYCGYRFLLALAFSLGFNQLLGFM